MAQQNHITALRRTFVGSAILGLSALFGLPATVSAAADLPTDLAGWQGTRWGMTDDNLKEIFGKRLEPLGGRLTYDGLHADRGVDGIRIGNVAFRALFQMSDDRDRLVQVLLEPEGKRPAQLLLRPVHDALRDAFGAPSTACVTPRAGGGPMTVEIVWQMPTTTVHLSLFDFRTQAIVSNDPNADPDPLTPYYKTRRNNPRFLPHRLVVRYHATERKDLISNCDPGAS